MIRVLAPLIALTLLAACSGGAADEPTEDSLRDNVAGFNGNVYDADWRAAYGWLNEDAKDACPLGEYLGAGALGEAFLDGSDVKLSDIEYEVESVNLRETQSGGYRATVKGATYLDGDVWEDDMSQVWVYEDDEWRVTTSKDAPCNPGT